MNRLVLIGNGFDLAHRLPTRYSDFINWYRKEWGARLLYECGRTLRDRFYSFTLSDSINLVNWYDVWKYHYCKSQPNEPWTEQEVLEIAQRDRNLCDYYNSSLLFEKICKEIYKPWCSIEDIYYAFLKSSDDPKQINDDLEFIKEKLIEYLNSLPTYSFNPTIQKQILAPISKEEIAIGSKSQWDEMMKDRLNYDDVEWEKLIDGYYTDYGSLLTAESSIKYFKNEFATDIRSGIFDNVMESACPAYRLPDNIMLLNFNYTNTADMYLPKSENPGKFEANHIHGTLNNPKSVIFGYGDERDDEYNVLMKKNDNEYLRHIKSFRYLDASNYRRMLAFIESDFYQICIMGHSCGVTDRTLLSTLFEHPNCVSIKPYYHQMDENKDDYRKLVQNIARNFTDPRLMRDRVVRKERCEPLGAK
ncbi:MAG: hypothetical protein J6T86_07965 [Bacteroidales bacterium]|nr:hypothetical protein [Bacteroidales bacterium]